MGEREEGEVAVMKDRGGDPPESSGGPPKKVSFRDKVLGGVSLSKQTLLKDLVLNNLTKIEPHEENKRRPRISFDRSVIETIWVPWRDVLVIKLLG